MSLLEPAPFQQLSADRKHPYYDKGANTAQLVITVDGVPVKDVITADTLNGYVKVYARDAKGAVVQEKLSNGQTRFKLATLKGVVGIYYEPEEEA